MGKKANLVYIFDPLCGWCYGFSPVILDLYARKQDELNFIVLCGGLAVDERALPIAEGYGFIPDSLDTITRHAGVTFGDTFREIATEGSYVFDSLPPSRAFIALRTLRPDKQVEYAHALHEAIFKHGEDLNDIEFLVSLADEFGCDPQQFNALLTSDICLKKTRDEFETVQRMGVTGFPFLFYADADRTVVLSNGYSSFNLVWSKLEALSAHHSL